MRRLPARRLGLGARRQRGPFARLRSEAFLGTVGHGRVARATPPGHQWRGGRGPLHQHAAVPGGSGGIRRASTRRGRRRGNPMGPVGRRCC
eukprot:14787859-Alexandrium_andersonii.AAC.1